MKDGQSDGAVPQGQDPENGPHRDKDDHPGREIESVVGLQDTAQALICNALRPSRGGGPTVVGPGHEIVDSAHRPLPLSTSSGARARLSSAYATEPDAQFLNYLHPEANSTLLDEKHRAGLRRWWCVLASWKTGLSVVMQVAVRFSTRCWERRNPSP